MNTRRAQNYWGGEWQDAVGGAVLERRNPARTDQVVSVAPDSGADDVTAAIDYLAENRHDWASAAPEKRAAALSRAADILDERAAELIVEIVEEEGKTRAEATVEATRTPQNLRMYATAALNQTGRSYPAADGTFVHTIHQPVGIVAAIAPWNFPLNIPSRKLGPALAAGNAVVFKPSEVTPWLGQRLVEALLEGGVPAGALALIHGGATVGQAMVADHRVAAVTFTGSTAVGEAIHRNAPMTTRCQLELGGKNAVMVADDADLRTAADIVMKGAFGLTGQACTGTSRVIINRERLTEFEQLLRERVDAAVPGDGLGDGISMGPLATEAQFAKFQHYLSVARDSGAREVTDATHATQTEGWFVRPAIFSDVKPDDTIAQEEVFGPLLAIIPVDSEADMVDVVNHSSYGLAAGIITDDLSKAMAFAREAEAGLIKVNQPTSGMAMNAPFGGMKRSSTQTSKEQAGEAMMSFFTVEKTVYVTY